MTYEINAKEVYETFCKLQARNTVQKRGKVICRDADAYYTPDKAVENFYNAILKAQTQELTALERVILVALRDLPTRQTRALAEKLKQQCLAEQGAVV